VFETFQIKEWDVRFLPWGRAGRGLLNKFIAQKPLPATSLPAAPLPEEGIIKSSEHLWTYPDYATLVDPLYRLRRKEG